MSIIKPTLGRVIWYNPMGSLLVSSNGYLTALICDVNADETVNLAVFDTKGNLHQRQNVPILDENQISSDHYARWMPYQVGQAAKAESLQAQVEALRRPEPPNGETTPDVPDEVNKMVDEGGPDKVQEGHSDEPQEPVSGDAPVAGDVTDSQDNPA